MALDVPVATVAPDACLVAHGTPDPVPALPRSLVVVYAGQTARYLAEFATACGYRVSVVEPDPGLADAARSWAAAVVPEVGMVAKDAGTDFVVTDHHREDLGIVLRDALRADGRWVGVMGNPRVVGPHIEQLTALGVAPEDIARVHRPIGLNIGSRTPAEIAISTLAGLLADRTGQPGGFDFSA